MTNIEIVNKILKPFQSKKYDISYNLNKKSIKFPENNVDGFFQIIIRKNNQMLYLISLNFDHNIISIMDIEKCSYDKYEWVEEGENLKFHVPKDFTNIARFNKSVKVRLQ